MGRARRSSERGQVRHQQLVLFRRGGKRRGAGRKPKGPRALVSHAPRPRIGPRSAVLVTSRLCAGLPTLRRPETRVVLHRALAAGADRFGFRLIHFSIQSNHLHVIAESPDASALSRGMQGLLVRIARALNRHWGRKGRVFSDRFHADGLKSPRAVRNALVYVLQNARKHGVFVDGPDPYTSGPWFDGWTVDRFGITDPRRALEPPPTVEPRAWLLRTGWRRHGLIDGREGPAAARRSA